MDYGNSTFGDIPYNALGDEFEGSARGAKTSFLTVEPTRINIFTVESTRDATLTLEPG